MNVRAIRGATTIEQNTASEIYEATSELFQEILKQNQIADAEALISVIITVTEDINAAFPARAVRVTPGFELVPVMGMQEIPVKGAPVRCIRMMVQANIDKPLAEIEHIYLKDAVRLRPDLVERKDS
ncbi:chorismate mutase [Listeria fleischmannii 1991]|uniref:chorismate mutase n=1 Tax=Listeria fleischmannii 1991 TaxID=1430899 RepID=A0A0J8GK14_9LIST|nr:chorismate mutase [Listeria fleischmannii 1991]